MFDWQQILATMGNYFTIVQNTIRAHTRKRRHSDAVEDSESDLDDEIDKRLRTPKRKKLMSTSRYIYKALFLDGLNSDVKLHMLGEGWNLHRVYLCQSPYFASMFSGAWKETYDDEIHIEIVDINITIDALKIVLGSLYKDEIVVEPTQVINVLGAAVLFQLDSLIVQCSEIMKETINFHTVIKYYDAGKQYGLGNIAKECFDWLLRNLLSCLTDHPKKLREISVDLMTELVSSPNLFVMQTEFSMYLLLKTWAYLVENPNWEGCSADCAVEAHKYFQRSEEECFLYSDIGEQYVPPFKGLRLHHLINHHLDVEMLETDKIIPKCWMMPVFRMQWYQMLRVDQGVDKGPRQMSEEEFNTICLRCGRTLSTDAHHVWRWTGYNFGLDLIVTYYRRIIKFKRNHRTDGDFQSSVSQQPRRYIMYKLTIASVDEQKQVTHSLSSGLQTVSLGRNEEVRVMQVESNFTFPLLLSANFVVTSPVSTTPSAQSSDLTSEQQVEVPVQNAPPPLEYPPLEVF